MKKWSPCIWLNIGAYSLPILSLVIMAWISCTCWKKWTGQTSNLSSYLIQLTNDFHAKCIFMLLIGKGTGSVIVVPAANVIFTCRFWEYGICEYSRNILPNFIKNINFMWFLSIFFCLYLFFFSSISSCCQHNVLWYDDRITFLQLISFLHAIL